MNIQEYCGEVDTEIKSVCAEENASEEKAYLSVMMNKLKDYDIINDFVLLDMDDIKAGSRIIRADAYSVDETEHSLSLYIVNYTDNGTNERLMQTELDKLYWRLQYFLDVVCNGDNFFKYFEMGSRAYAAASFVRSHMNCPVTNVDRILKLKFCILTNKELDTKILSKDFFEETKGKRKLKAGSKRKIKKREFQNRIVEIDLWNIERFFEIETAGINEAITIDFNDDYDSIGIPCIKGNIGNSTGYDAYMGIIPGKLLADIYIDHGSRVLEGNVRAFLGTKSAKGVNNGIKRTINNEPSMFFTYNNGIAATAAEVTTEVYDGQLYVTSILDLQIINGGQTTATLAEAVLKKTNLYLDGIFVPIKLTVIPDREQETEDGVLVYNKMIHDIARFANSQNKVTAADLFSNDPFHIWMENTSKKVMAPTAQYPIPTGWYYERTRKKYEQEQMKYKGNDLKRFQAKYPKKQVIKKEELALYLAAVECKPNICSRGKNWVMKDFGTKIGEVYSRDKASFNEYFFKKCICAAILYRTIDAYLETNKKDPDFWYSVGGYKSNIIPYTIAKILDALPKDYTLNWTAIWNKQKLSDALMEEIKKVSFAVNNYFCSMGGVLISEHCKKETTWLDFKKVPYTISDALKDELITVEEEKAASKSAMSDQRDTTELENIIALINQGVNYWQSLLENGIKRDMLDSSDQFKIQKIIEFIDKGIIPQTKTGKVPLNVKKMLSDARAVESKLKDDGFDTYFNDDDEAVNIVLHANDKMI